MGTEAVHVMGIAEHTGGGDDVTVPVNNWDQYLSGWDFGNSVLQLVVNMFPDDSRSIHLKCIQGAEGENCLTNDQLEKKDPVTNEQDFEFKFELQLYIWRNDTPKRSENTIPKINTDIMTSNTCVLLH